MMSVFRLGFVAAVFILSACANHPCVHMRNPELAAQSGSEAAVQPSSSTAPTPIPAMTPSKESAAKMSAKPAVSNTVLVFKADGSLQCGQGKGLAIEEMEKELKGIKVLSRDKRPDGKMHIQLCGSPTGMINVFEISEKNLKDAEARGFKKL